MDKVQVSSSGGPDRYKEPVGDHELLAMIEQGITNSVGDFLNSSDLARKDRRPHTNMV